METKRNGGVDLSNSLSTLMNNSVLSFNLMPDYYVLVFFLSSSFTREGPRQIGGGVSCRGPTGGSNARTRTKNEKAAVQSLRCQLDKYNVSPIKNSLPFFNSAEALLTAAWQGGCRRIHGPCDRRSP